MSKDFYVYVHKKSTNGKVFYVGKGSGYRAWSKQRSSYWSRIVAKHGYTVEIVHSGMQEWWAFELECELIASYGRDVLCNMSDGGDGPSGWVPSEETKKRMKIAQNEPSNREKKSIALKGKKRPKHIVEKIGKSQIGKVITQETRDKLSKALKGRVCSNETREKLIKAQNKPETKQKRRDNLLGKKHTEEHKKAISDSLKGRVFSIESRIKSSNSQKGVKKSDDAKQKMKDGWARKKSLLLLKISMDIK